MPILKITRCCFVSVSSDIAVIEVMLHYIVISLPMQRTFLAGCMLAMWMLSSSIASATIEELNHTPFARTKGLSTLYLEVGTVSPNELRLSQITMKVSAVCIVAQEYIFPHINVLFEHSGKALYSSLFL